MSRIGPREPGIFEATPRRSLADLLWVANTRHGPGGHWFARVVDDSADHDHLDPPAAAVKYLVDHKVSVPGQEVAVDEITAAQLRSLEAIREMVRGLLDRDQGWTPAVRSILARTRFVVGEDGRLTAGGSGWDGFVGDLLIPLIQLVDARDRLRICGNPHCRLIFLDLSRNQARQWCDNGGCGNRDRVRRYRSRRRGSGSDQLPAGPGYSPR